jgi:hypothetical protein
VHAESQPSRPRAVNTRKFKMHWHVVLTHFPVTGFTGTFLFMGLHILTRNPCYVSAAYVALVASTITLIPTTATGWYTWKRRYRGHRNTIFLIKIWLSAAMIPLSAALVAYQTIHPFEVIDIPHRVGHLMYMVGVLALMGGSFAEGAWGGRLHHR